MNNLRLYAVNWQDGMLLTQRHFQDQERFLAELARWYAMPSGDGYGLVRKGHGAPPALSVNLAVTGDRLTIELIRCQAVTPNGYFVEIDSSRAEPVQTAVPAPSGDVPVYLCVTPDKSVPTGSADPGEDLPRLPYLLAGYALHVGERPIASEGEVLQIAQLEVRGNEVRLAADYYPPCVNTYADERLHQKVTDLRNRLESLMSIGSRAYGAVKAGEKTELQAALYNVIHDFVSHLAATLDDFVVGPNAGHPHDTFRFFRKLFRTFYTLLGLHPGVKDFVHEKYFVKQAGMDISQFISMIDNYLLAEYNHEHIGGHVLALEHILEHIKGLLSHLAQVKSEQLGPQAVATDSLAYLGRTYMVSPYAGTRVEQVGELIYLEIKLAKPRPMRDAVILLAKSLFSVQDWPNMHVRLGLNEARGLGEPDPVAGDAPPYGD
jgi:hypothetical protein